MSLNNLITSFSDIGRDRLDDEQKMLRMFKHAGLFRDLQVEYFYLDVPAPIFTTQAPDPIKDIWAPIGTQFKIDLNYMASRINNSGKFGNGNYCFQLYLNDAFISVDSEEFVTGLGGTTNPQALFIKIENVGGTAQPYHFTVANPNDKTSNSFVQFNYFPTTLNLTMGHCITNSEGVGTFYDYNSQTDETVPNSAPERKKTLFFNQQANIIRLRFRIEFKHLF
jgi:hypothetical protein